MAKYIDKSALVAEIQKRRNKHFNSGGSPSSEYCHEDDEIFGIIATLEVKEIGVDIGSPDGDICVKTIWDGDKIVSNKAQKGEEV